MLQGVGLSQPGIASPFRHPNQYYQKVKRIAGGNLLAYWPQWEGAGSVAHDISGNSPAGERDGAYTGVTLAQPGIGDGNLAPFFDATNDFNNVVSASLQAAFDGDEGTTGGWLQMDNAGVWTDGTIRYLLQYFVDSSNRVHLFKDSVNNRFALRYVSGGVAKQVNADPISTLNVFHAAVTWSASADQFIAYIDGVQIGSVQTGLGAWVGVPGTMIIGAASVVPSNVHEGIIGHPFLMDRAVTPREMASLGSLNDD
jgi:hypothetical protein